jgi:hypothetical protein
MLIIVGVILIIVGAALLWFFSAERILQFIGAVLALVGLVLVIIGVFDVAKVESTTASRPATLVALVDYEPAADDVDVVVPADAVASTNRSSWGF